MVVPISPKAAECALLRGSVAPRTPHQEKMLPNGASSPLGTDRASSEMTLSLPEEFSGDNCTRSLENNRSGKYRLNHHHFCCVCYAEKGDNSVRGTLVEMLFRLAVGSRIFGQICSEVQTGLSPTGACLELVR